MTSTTPPSYSQNLVAHMCLVAVPFLASGNTIMGRMSMGVDIFKSDDANTEPLHPLTLSIARCIISVTIFSILLWREEREAEKKEEDDEGGGKGGENKKEDAVVGTTFDRVKLAGLGFVGITLNFYFFLLGISLLPAIVVAGWMSTVPMTVSVLAALSGYENFSGALGAAKCCAILLVLLGNVLLSHLWRIFSSEDSIPAANSDAPAQGIPILTFMLGTFAMILNTTCFSAYLVFTKPLAPKFSIITFTHHVQAAGLVGLLFISLIPTENIVTRQLLSPLTGKHRLAPISWATIAYAGFVQSSLTYFLLGYGIKISGSPVTASLLNNLQPSLVVLEAVLLLGETMDNLQMVGAGLIITALLGSIYVSLREKQQEVAAAVAEAKSKRENEEEEHVSRQSGEDKSPAVERDGGEAQAEAAAAATVDVPNADTEGQSEDG